MLILRKEGVMTERSPETRRFWQAAAIVAMGSLALSGCTAAGSTEASQSDASQSADMPQSSCEFPTEFDINPEHHIDSTFEEDFLALASSKESGALGNEDLANFIKDQAKTNATFLLDGAEQYGILLDTEIADKTRFVSNGCLTSEGVAILHRFNNKIDSLHHEMSVTPAGMYTSAQSPEGDIYVTNATGIYADTPAIKSIDPVTGEVRYTTIKCGNGNRADYQIKNIPRGDLPQPPKPVTPPTPEQPQQPGPQPKGDTGVESPEGTQGEVNWNPSGDGHIGPETTVPAGPQVQNEGSSEWTYTPPASPQVAPGAPSNTAVAPGAEPAPAAPTPAPAPAITNEGIRLPDNQENDGDVDPDGN